MVENKNVALCIVLSIVTCGIYGFYWAYKQGEKLDRAENNNSSSGVLYLVLTFFGLGIVAYALMQDRLNKSFSSTQQG